MYVTKQEIMADKEGYAAKVLQGAVFLHPTDTINGIGCNAQLDNAVQFVRRIKNNKSNPLSVIAPSKKWIKENCVIPKGAEKWLDKLPGPYTLVLRLKKKNAVSRYVNPNDDTIGVRLPNHWISEFVAHLGVPIISTSANVQGGEYTEDIERLHPALQNNLHFMIYEVNRNTKPSDIVILTGKTPRLIKRQKLK